MEGDFPRFHSILSVSTENLGRRGRFFLSHRHAAPRMRALSAPPARSVNQLPLLLNARYRTH